MKPSKPNRYDLIPALLIAVFGAAALIFGVRLFAGSGEALTAEISLNGTVTESVVLSSLPQQGRHVTLENNGETLTVLLEQDGVSVTDSTCRGHDCVHTGKITKAGRSIVCLPGRIVITLKNSDGKTSDIDIYAG